MRKWHELLNKLEGRKNLLSGFKNTMNMFREIENVQEELKEIEVRNLDCYTAPPIISFPQPSP